VRFWDPSAVVPLCVVEPATAQVRRLSEEDGALVAWWTTRTECISALARRRREGGIGAAVEERARAILASLAASWSEVLPSEAVRERAERLLGAHPLRAADGLQLAAALVWSRERTRGQAFVCFDERLRAAAAREGFSVLPA
jgi:hypothetical protein